MGILSGINYITLFIACVFLLPIISGMIHPFSSSRIRYSLSSLLDIIGSIIAVIMAVYMTRTIFLGSGAGILASALKNVPYIRNSIENRDVLAFVIIALILYLIFRAILKLIALPFYRFVIDPLSDMLSSAVNAMPGGLRHAFGGICQIPKSIWFVLLFSLLFSVYTGFDRNSSFSQYIDDSSAYRLVDDNVISPLLSTSVAKQIPVLIDDTLKNTVNNLSPEGRKHLITIYLNGTTIDEAIKSDSDINACAKKVVGSEKNDRQKAYLLYKWICENVKYDYGKAGRVESGDYSEPSGAIAAYNSRTGICFDYSSLYVAMCRAVGLKVRLVTGLGYNGSEWGSHAWNQVYYPAENRWINLDATFGSSGSNYFDKSSFSDDHTNAEVMGEW